MKKIILVGLAILAVSTSGALAAKKATKPKAPAAAATTTTTTTTTNPGGAAPFMLGQVSASDRELYEKSQRESGMKK
jgi:ABC-type transport system substrate-binding protein